MKVLIIAQYYPPDMGGGATRAYNIAKGLSLAGVEVTVVTAFPHYPTGDIPVFYRRKLISIENEGKIRVIRTFVPPVASEGLAKRILLFSSFICSSICALPVVRKVDAIWASNPNVIGVIPSIFYKIFNRCPIVQNVDDLWPEALFDLGMNEKSVNAKLCEFIAKVTYRFASAITPISPGYVQTLIGKYQVEPSKVSVVLAGVDLTMFTQGPEAKQQQGKFRVLYIGAFSPAYDFDQVFKAAKLLEKDLTIEFIIQGGGELASTLELKSKQINLINVRVNKKIISRQEVVTELNNSDALLLPLNGIGSIEMGISSKLYEYQAAGKPILCCSNGQPGHYVISTKSGLVVKPGDYNALASEVLYLKTNPDLALTLGQNGKHFVESKASIVAVGKTMHSILKSLIRH